MSDPQTTISEQETEHREGLTDPEVRAAHHLWRQLFDLWQTKPAVEAVKEMRSLLAKEERERCAKIVNQWRKLVAFHYTNAEPDEPMFVLLGRDPHAASAVRKWADDREQMIKAELKPADDIRMVWEARECADAMEAYCIERAARHRNKLNTTLTPRNH